jgi:hypothetical protein
MRPSIKRQATVVMGLVSGLGLAGLAACSDSGSVLAAQAGDTAQADGGAEGSASDTGAVDGSLVPETGDSSTESSPPDSGGPDAPWVIAQHPAMPQVESSGGPVLASPVFTSITFPKYDLTSVVDALISTVGSTPYWTAATSEYGVGPGSSAMPVHLTEPAPGTIDDFAVSAWLAAKLDGTHPEFGTPTSNSLYVVYYPSTTTVTNPGLGTSCVDFRGYHNDVQLSGGLWSGLDVAYAVVAECAFTALGMSVLDTVTGVTTHELAEAVTDPQVSSNPAFSEIDFDQVVWSDLSHGAEIGDMCERLPGSFFTPPSYPSVVQRMWSNTQGGLGHDPCQPAPANEVYFNAAPVLTDDVDNGSTKGVLIALHQNKTVEVDLYSDGPMAPWTVSAKDTFLDLLGGGPYLSFSWDATTGSNGTKLHLTITPLAPTQFGGEPFVIESTDGTSKHLWFGYVAQN